jgi:protein phosphatase
MRNGTQNGFKGTNLLELAVAQANWVVYDTAQRFMRFRGMGTTLVLALAQEEQWFLAHVGDSRAYLWRDGQLYQMTTDHTVVQEMVKAGYLTEQQAAVHPRRHVITRAVGVADSVKVDIQVIPALPGDCLLLCSDGLADSMTVDNIADILERESEPRKALHRLIDTANRKDGSDNITAVLMFAEAGEANG